MAELTFQQLTDMQRQVIILNDSLQDVGRRIIVLIGDMNELEKTQSRLKNELFEIQNELDKRLDQ